jgi:hypothetical protein
MSKATKTTRRSKTAETTYAPSPGLPEVANEFWYWQGKDVHLEKDNHKVCVHCHDGNPPTSKNTMSVMEYLDGKIVSSERLSVDDGNKVVAALLKEGYQIVHPETGKDDD